MKQPPEVVDVDHMGLLEGMEVEYGHTGAGETTNQLIPVLGNLELGQADMFSEPRRVLPLGPLDEPPPVLRSGPPAEELANRITHAPAVPAPGAKSPPTAPGHGWRPRAPDPVMTATLDTKLIAVSTVFAARVGGRMGHNRTPPDPLEQVLSAFDALTWATRYARTRGGRNADFTRPGMVK